MSTPMVITISVLVVTAAMFVWGKIRSDIVALSALLVLVITNVISTEAALKGFSNPIVIMIPALFIVGGAISQTGLAGTVSNTLQKVAGKNPYMMFILVILATTIIGSFLSNTGTVAMLMPIVVSLAAKTKSNVRRLLMPMAFASSIGGMMTLIGTAPTLVVHNALIEGGYAGLGFFTTLPAGIILLLVGILLLWPLTKVLEKRSDKDLVERKSAVKSPDQLASAYQVIENLYRLEIPAHSPIIHKKLSELNITKLYDVVITEIRTRTTTPLTLTRNITVRLPEASTVLMEGEIIFVIGEYGDVLRFVDENGLIFMDETGNGHEHKPKFAGKFKFEEIGMAEVVILANSHLHNRLVKDSGFRRNYNVNILAILRRDQYIIHDVMDMKMQEGDMLLVQGTWENIGRLGRLESDVVVIGQPENEASKITLNHKAPIAGITLVLMVLSMALNWLPLVISVLLACVVLILTKCFRTVKDAYRTINWESVILFASMMSIGVAMKETGTSAVITNGIVNTLGVYGPYVLLAGILTATSFLTLFISNTATAILFAPISLQAAISMGVSPYPFLIGVTVAASMCLASPFSTPPNAMVMSAGKYNFMDYIKVGLPLQVIYIIVMIFALPLLFPF